MKLSELLSGRPDFSSETEIIRFVRNSKRFDSATEELTSAQALLIFSTSKQHTWLISTARRLYCVLDDLRKDHPNINWSMSQSEVIKNDQVSLAIATRDKSDFTGLVDIGDSHQDWLYTKRLFSDAPIEERIRQLIEVTMMPKH